MIYFCTINNSHRIDKSLFQFYYSKKNNNLSIWLIIILILLIKISKNNTIILTQNNNRDLHFKIAHFFFFFFFLSETSIEHNAEYFCFFTHITVKKFENWACPSVARSSISRICRFLQAKAKQTYPSVFNHLPPSFQRHRVTVGLIVTILLGDRKN